MAVEKKTKYLRVAALISSATFAILAIMMCFLIQLTKDRLIDYAPSLMNVEASISTLAIPVSMMVICGLNYISTTKKNAEAMISANKISKRKPQILNILMGAAAAAAIIGFVIGIVLFFNGLKGGIPDTAIFLVMFISSFLANLITLAIILWEDFLQGDKRQLYIYGSLAIVLAFICPLVGAIPFLASQNQNLLMLMAGIPVFYTLYFLRNADDAGRED